MNKLTHNCRMSKCWKLLKSVKTRRWIEGRITKNLRHSKKVIRLNENTPDPLREHGTSLLKNPRTSNTGGLLEPVSGRPWRDRTQLENT